MATTLDQQMQAVQDELNQAIEEATYWESLARQYGGDDGLVRAKRELGPNYQDHLRNISQQRADWTAKRDRAQAQLNSLRLIYQQTQANQRDITAPLPSWWDQASPEQKAAYIARQATGSSGGGAPSFDEKIFNRMTPEQQAAYLQRIATGGGAGAQAPWFWDQLTPQQKADYLAKQATGAQGGRTFEQDVQLAGIQNTFAAQRQREQQQADARKAASDQAIQIAQMQAPWATSTGEFGGFEEGGPYQAMLNMAGVGQQGYKNRPTPVQVPIPNPQPGANFIAGPQTTSVQPTLAGYIGGMQTNINPSDLFNFMLKLQGQPGVPNMPPPRFPIGGQ